MVKASDTPRGREGQDEGTTCKRGEQPDVLRLGKAYACAHQRMPEEMRLGGEWVRGLGAAAAERLRYGGLRTYVMRTTRYGTKTGQGKECGRARGRPATRSYMDATFEHFSGGKVGERHAGYAQPS